MSKINFPQHLFIHRPDVSDAAILRRLVSRRTLHLTSPLSRSLSMLIAQVSNHVDGGKELSKRKLCLSCAQQPLISRLLTAPDSS